MIVRATGLRPTRMTLIALLTDFGEADGYVAAMKGTILGICPDARFLDISHQIQPQAIDQGAYVLGTVYPYLPAGTIYLAVVDPEVGTERAGLALQVPRGLLVGPDNGLFSDVLHQAMGYGAREGIAPAQRVPGGRAPLPAGCAGVVLDIPSFWRDRVSPTFHGRDIFAPVAAHLARGVAVSDLGSPVQDLIQLGSSFRREPDGRLFGRVRHVDRFGNLITSIPMAALTGRAWRIRIETLTIRGVSRTYADGRAGCPLALGGSAGQLEVAVRDGNAAITLGVGLGAAVVAEPANA